MTTRFYRPRLAQLTGAELMFARSGIEGVYQRNPELDAPIFDFVAPAAGKPIMTRRIALRHGGEGDTAFYGMGPFQITYNFSHAIRRNDFPVKNVLPFQPKTKGQYGAKGWSFRMLYEFLCDFYNGGELFIDTYFAKVFKTRPVYRRFRGIYSRIEDDINAEQLDLFMGLPLKADGTPDMRYTVSRRFMDFKVWQDPIIKRDSKYLAKEIQADIVRCLYSGKLPLRGKSNPMVARATRQRRAVFGGMEHPSRLFYASGQLIKHLNIFVEIGGAAA